MNKVFRIYFYTLVLEGFLVLSYLILVLHIFENQITLKRLFISGITVVITVIFSIFGYILGRLEEPVESFWKEFIYNRKILFWLIIMFCGAIIIVGILYLSFALNIWGIKVYSLLSPYIIWSILASIYMALLLFLCNSEAGVKKLSDISLSLNNSITRYSTFLGVPILLLINYFLRHNLENADKYIYPFLPSAFPDQTPYVFNTYPWWKLLLPIKEFTGIWNVNLVITYLLESVISAAVIWYLLYALVIIVSFFLSWIIFRSAIFSYTLAICMGFGTQLYHIYQVNGGVGYNLLYILYFCILFIGYKIIFSAKHQILWKFLFVITVVVTAIQYEGWLDFLVFTWGASLFLGILFWQKRNRQLLSRLIFMIIVLNVVGLIYIYIKFTYIGFIHGQGTESDVVFNYPNLVPMIEDVISNYMTHIYIALTNFLPPPFIGSNSLYMFGGEKLVEWQYGYHQDRSYLVPMNYIFLWRFFAGALFVIYIYCLVKVLTKALRDPSSPKHFDYIVLSIFMLMTAVGGPTHTFIKFRPMNSVPLLGYHVLVGILGISLVISYLLLMVRKYIHIPNIPWLIIGVTWFVLLYSALARPAFIGHMDQLVGLMYSGSYPDPLQALITLLRSLSITV